MVAIEVLHFLDEAAVVQVQVQLKAETMDVDVVVDLVVGQCEVIRLVLFDGAPFVGICLFSTSGACLVVGVSPALITSAGLVGGAALRGGGPCDFEWLRPWAVKS